MTKRLPLAGALAGVLALAGVPAAAHHGTAITYFVDKSITPTGVVTEFVYGYPQTDQMRLQERYRLLDADTLELTMTITDPEFYAKPFQSDVKLFRRDHENEKAWDEQIYCVASEEQRFNRLIRDGGVGK